MYDTRNKYNIVHIKCRTIKYAINSFTYAGAKRWNEVSQDFKVLPSIEDFKDDMASFNARTYFLAYYFKCAYLCSLFKLI